MIDSDKYLKTKEFYAGSERALMAVCHRTSYGEFIGWALTCTHRDLDYCDVLVNSKGDIRVFKTLDAVRGDIARCSNTVHQMIVDWA